MNFLLEIDNTKDIYEAGSDAGAILLEGAQIVLIGMATVFAVLCLLWAFLTIFKMVFYDTNHKKSAITVVEKNDDTAPAEYESASSDDEEIVAVISAAIAALESESGGVKYRVVSFKRK